MRVRDWMTLDVVTVTPQTSVLNARQVLLRHGIRHLPVVEGARVVGVVSDRDLQVHDPLLLGCLTALQSELVAGRYRPVAALMTDPVLSVGPDKPLAAAARLMADCQIGALPVVDGGQLVGILTTTDCLRALARTEGSDHAAAGQLTSAAAGGGAGGG